MYESLRSSNSIALPLFFRQNPCARPVLYWSTSVDDHQFPVVVVADGLPATAFQQRIQPVSPAANSGRHRHNLRPIIIKTDMQRAFQQTDAVYRR